MEKIDYSELYRRNWPIIPLEQQEKLKVIKIGVAGCGSTGGAFIEGAVRLGIQGYHLADNGAYELNNLNRQMVFVKDIDRNKAKTYEFRIKDINPNAIVRVWDSGITDDGLEAFLEGLDFLFDAVDVTTVSGMQMKLALHKAAFNNKIPTGSALDLGYTQWLQSYNYHRGDELLKGRFESASKVKHPLKALIYGFSPIEELPLEITEEILRLLRNPNESACQLACVCFALSGLVTPYMLHFVKHGYLPSLIQHDLIEQFEDSDVRSLRRAKEIKFRKELFEELNRIK